MKYLIKTIYYPEIDDYPGGMCAYAQIGPVTVSVSSNCNYDITLEQNHSESAKSFPEKFAEAFKLFAEEIEVTE